MGAHQVLDSEWRTSNQNVETGTIIRVLFPSPPFLLVVVVLLL